jgi:predicted nucleotidyltransferase
VKTLPDILRLLDEHKAELRDRFGVRSLALLGSYARGEATELSDVDILVDLERPIGWEVCGSERLPRSHLGRPGGSSDRGCPPA